VVGGGGDPPPPTTLGGDRDQAGPHTVTLSRQHASLASPLLGQGGEDGGVVYGEKRFSAAGR
jgi:hypothetical protein